VLVLAQFKQHQPQSQSLDQTSRWHNTEVGLCDSRVPVLQLFLADLVRAFLLLLIILLLLVVLQVVKKAVDNQAQVAVVLVVCVAQLQQRAAAEV
jgi:hypothetical protein